jgi:hypothetical protein
MVIGAASASAKTAPVAAVPKTRVATPGEAAKAAPAATPTKSSMGMFLGIGGGVAIAVVAVFFVMNSNKGKSPSLPAAGLDTSHTVQAPPPTNTKPQDANNQPAGKSTPPNDGEKQAPSKETKSQPPSGGNANPNGGGAAAPTISEKDMKELDDLTDGVVANGEDPDQAIAIANRILPLAQGEVRAKIFSRRASAYMLQEKNNAACTDLRAAKSLTTDSALMGYVDRLWKLAECTAP